MTRARVAQLLSAGLLALLTACQAAGQSLNVAFRPGDTIDGMGLATGASEAPPLSAFCSGSQQGDHMQTFDCRAPVLSTLAIGHLFLLSDEASPTWAGPTWPGSSRSTASPWTWSHSEPLIMSCRPWQKALRPFGRSSRKRLPGMWC